MLAIHKKISIVILSTILATANVSVALSGQTILMSSSDTGAAGNKSSSIPYTTDNFAAFYSSATNLTPESLPGIFIYQISSRETQLILSTPFVSDVSIDGSGTKVVFSTNTSLLPEDTNTSLDVYLFDRQNSILNLISRDTAGNGPGGFRPIISENGLFIAFQTNNSEIRVRDLQTGIDEIICPLGDFPYLSSDGRFVVYSSGGGRGKKIYVKDRQTGVVELITPIYDGISGFSNIAYNASISGDGRFIVFCGQQRNILPEYPMRYEQDVFLYDRQDKFFEIISINSDQQLANGWSGDYTWRSTSIGADGRFVAFESRATNLAAESKNDWNIFIRDRLLKTTELVTPKSQSDISTYDLGSISGNSRYVAYMANSQAYLRDRSDDKDGDGFPEGEDCDDYNFNINPNTEEIPYNGYDDNCNGMADDDDLDLDGFGIISDCNDNDQAINPIAVEIPYSGSDENCNGMADDDDLDHDGYGIATDCNDNNATTHPDATEIKHDGIDQDCNGYDLTIDITVADYDTINSLLTVKASSSRGLSANLEVLGYGPMIWKETQQVWKLDFQGPNPGMITVTGFEGAETASVTVQ